uniref:Thymidylate synthase n=1 Tax=Romanomermis culicivorax TaxID=13658 RepID=A0A915KIC6_ROMCU
MNLQMTNGFINENYDEKQFLCQIERLLKNGEFRNDRTGIGTYSIFGTQLRFNLRNGNFPLLTTRKIFWRAVVEELLWFVRGSTNAEELSAKKIRIWDANSCREFLDKRGLEHYEAGDLGPIYGFQWRHFGATYKTTRDDYKNQGIDQLKYCIDLIKNDPNNRRIIMTSWNPLG